MRGIQAGDSTPTQNDDGPVVLNRPPAHPRVYAGERANDGGNSANSGGRVALLTTGAVEGGDDPSMAAALAASRAEGQAGVAGPKCEPEVCGAGSSGREAFIAFRGEGRRLGDRT